MEERKRSWGPFRIYQLISTANPLFEWYWAWLAMPWLFFFYPRSHEQQSFDCTTIKPFSKLEEISRKTIHCCKIVQSLASRNKLKSCYWSSQLKIMTLLSWSDRTTCKHCFINTFIHVDTVRRCKIFQYKKGKWSLITRVWKTYLGQLQSPPMIYTSF